MNSLFSVLIVGLIVVAAVVFSAFLIQLGWSLFMVDYFSFNPINFSQALGLAILMPKNINYNGKK